MREPESVYRRRRSLASGGVVMAFALVLLLFSLGGSGDDAADRAGGGDTARASRPEPRELPRGGRRLFPDFRVVGFYGAPQDDELGALGIGSPDGAARRLERQARPYVRRARPVLPALELLATVADRAPGPDGLYRTRQSPEVIDRYLRAARRHKAILLLDIQPGHADFLVEARQLERWLREPDVGLALDPEWHTPGAVPGTQIGSVTSQQVNAVSAWLDAIVREENLPQKLFLVHQFTDDMIEGKDRVKRRPGLAITMNVDGFGDRPNKVSKYRGFLRDELRFNAGFKLFYKEDTNLMRPADVLSLRPPPDVVVYE